MRLRPRRVFWRVYLYGLGLLVAVVVGIAVANAVYGPPAGYDPAPRVARYVDGILAPKLDDPAGLQAEIERAHEAFETDLAVFDADGRQLAAAGEPLEALTELPDRPKALRGGGAYRFAVPIAEGRAYLVGAYHWRGGDGGRWLLIPLVILGVVALVSLPLARGIVRPIERVTVAARKLGEGDLSARANLRRKDELGALADTFDQMASRLERMVAGNRELLANVSHELRTPLARIRIALELVEESSDPAIVRKHLAGISGDLAELESLVSQVLTNAKLDLADGAFALDRAPVALADVVAEAVARCERHHPERELVVHEADVVVEGDAKLLRRLLDNLLDNAVKHAPDGAIEVGIATGSADEGAEMWVRDHGPGVPPDDLPRLFEPFFRSDPSRERGTGGVGLGLLLCQRIAEAHQGGIEARLPDGGGLELRVSLPRPSGADRRSSA